VLAGVACGRPSTTSLVFLHGRATVPVTDSLAAVTSDQGKALLLINMNSGAVDSMGIGSLTSGVHVELTSSGWLVSDVEDGAPSLVAFNRAGQVTARRSISTVTETAHQFAVLPDARVVVEAPDDRLVTINLHDDSVTTFALTERGPRPSLLVGAFGGVLHAVPDKSITLYNGFGNIRWRTEWWWDEGAFVTDLAIDVKGRIHLIAGVPGGAGEDFFVVYSIIAQTGEVSRWSVPGPYATFVVDRLGEVTPSESIEWVR